MEIWVLCPQERATGSYPQPNSQMNQLCTLTLSLILILILYSHLCLHLQVVSFLKVIWLTCCTHFSINCLIHALLSELPWFYHSNNIWRGVQHFQFLRYTFSPELLVLKHPQSIFNVTVLKTGREGSPIPFYTELFCFSLQTRTTFGKGIYYMKLVMSGMTLSLKNKLTRL